MASILLEDPAESETLDYRSVTGQRWHHRRHDSRHALSMSQTHGLPELLGRILASRGVRPEDAASFLQPTLRHFLPDPFHLKDMEKAAFRIAEEVAAFRSHAAGGIPRQPDIHNFSPIAIFGDYDVDGATSSALLVRYFRFFGIEPLVHIPDRMKEGYGPNTPALLTLKEKGARLVITVDCGTLAFAPLASARDAGLDVIVVDHHKGDAQLPNAFAVVNPNRADETSPHTQLAACGVTFLLMVAVNKRLRERGIAVPDLLQWLDLVALGTICDVVPLTGPNRALVTQGLKILAGRGNAGIAAAMDTASLLEPPGTYHAGYIIGPRINAGGRVGEAHLGVRLLSTEDASEAAMLAESLHRYNAERKAIESGVQEEALEAAHALDPDDAVIVVAREGWHAGVIGIVAGRLKEHFRKPAAVIALKGGVGKASARSISGIDLGAAVIAATHHGLLLGGGGHAMAAGFSISQDHIAGLRTFFNARMGGRVAELAADRWFWVDGAISIAGLTLELARFIEQAGPYGAGHPAVRLMVANVRVVHAAIVGEDHVRVVVVDAGASGSSMSMKAMAFRAARTPIGEALLAPGNRPLHLAGQLRINHWQGRESVDFFIDDVALRN